MLQTIFSFKDVVSRPVESAGPDSTGANSEQKDTSPQGGGKQTGKSTASQIEENHQQPLSDELNAAKDETETADHEVALMKEVSPSEVISEDSKQEAQEEEEEMVANNESEPEKVLENISIPVESMDVKDYSNSVVDTDSAMMRVGAASKGNGIGDDSASDSADTEDEKLVIDAQITPQRSGQRKLEPVALNSSDEESGLVIDDDSLKMEVDVSIDKSMSPLTGDPVMETPNSPSKDTPLSPSYSGLTTPHPGTPTIPLYQKLTVIPFNKWLTHVPDSSSHIRSTSDTPQSPPLSSKICKISKVKIIPLSEGGEGTQYEMLHQVSRVTLGGGTIANRVNVSGAVVDAIESSPSSPDVLEQTKENADGVDVVENEMAQQEQPHDAEEQPDHVVKRGKGHDVEMQQVHDVEMQQTHVVKSEQPQNMEKQQTHVVKSEQPQNVEKQQTHVVKSEQPQDVEKQQAHVVKSEQPQNVEKQQTHVVKSEQPQNVEKQQAHVVKGEQGHIMDKGRFYSRKSKRISSTESAAKSASVDVSAGIDISSSGASHDASVTDPKKSQMSAKKTQQPASGETLTSEVPVKRRRGRPRKVQVPATEVMPKVMPEVIPEVMPKVIPEVIPEVIHEVMPEVMPNVIPEAVAKVTPKATHQVTVQVEVHREANTSASSSAPKSGQPLRKRHSETSLSPALIEAINEEPLPKRYVLDMKCLINVYYIDHSLYHEE